MSESTGVVKAGPAAIQLAEQYPTWTPDQVALIRSTLLGNKGTPDELSLLLHQATRTGLDPLHKQIYGIFRWDRQLGREKMTIQVGIDGFRAIAEQTGQLSGSKTFWCGKDGIWSDVFLGDGYPFAAKTVIWRKGCDETFEATARWDEYVQTDKNNNPTHMWKKISTTMLGKCSEALALRKAFPHKLSGLYTPEEMMQAESEGVGTMEGVAQQAAPADPAREVQFQPKADESKIDAGVARKEKVVALPDPDSVTIKQLTAKPTQKCAISGKPLGEKGDKIAYAQFNGGHWMARQDEYLRATANDPVEAEFEDVPEPEGKVDEEQGTGLVREALEGTPAGRLLDELAGPAAESAPEPADGIEADLPN